MTALYRSDRQAEALAAYQDTRRVLVEELGIEPSPGLRELEQSILRQDPSLVLRPLPAVLARPPAGPRSVDKRAQEDPPSEVFVGRDRELAALLGALEDAVSGRGRLVVIGGEPGIGKSRLAEELASRATNTGGEVLWGRCWEAEGAPPYWPWVQAIRSYAREADPERLRAELGTGAAEIADVVTDVRERLPDLGPAPGIDDPKIARFRLFESHRHLPEERVRAWHLVLVLDDLHWADEGSLRLLEFVARELGRVAIAADRYLPRRGALTPAPALANAGRADPRAPLRADCPARARAARMWVVSSRSLRHRLHRRSSSAQCTRRLRAILFS